VAEIHGRVVVGWVRRFKIGCIGGRGLAVRFCGLFVAAHPLQDVGRHVNQVARGRCEAREPGSGGKALFRMRRRFDCVHVIVESTHVGWIAREHAFQRGGDFRGTLSRRSVS
jgi:hypothetical protein